MLSKNTTSTQRFLKLSSTIGESSRLLGMQASSIRNVCQLSTINAHQLEVNTPPSSTIHQLLEVSIPEEHVLQGIGCCEETFFGGDCDNDG